MSNLVPCTHCGGKVAKNCTRCPHCGGTYRLPTKPPEPIPWKGRLLLAAIFGMIGILAFLYVITS